MTSLFTMEATLRRLRETEMAIVAQRAYVDSLDDPAAKATAEHSLKTLEDILVIVQRTHLLLLAATRESTCAQIVRAQRGRGRPR